MSENSIYNPNRLSIFILQDGFSFLVTNEFKAVLIFESIKMESAGSASELLKIIKNYITSGFIVQNNIKSFSVIYGNPQFSIVPEAYFDESHLPHYIKYSSKLIEGDDFSYDSIAQINAKTVFIPYININNYFFDIFGEFKFTHVFTELIESRVEKSRNFQDYIGVHVTSNLIYFTAFQNQHLVLANAFSYETAEDLVYYILFAIEELHMNRESLTIDFTGNFLNTDHNEALSILRKYIANIAFSNLPSSTEYDFRNDFQEHYNLI